MVSYWTYVQENNVLGPSRNCWIWRRRHNKIIQRVDGSSHEHEHRKKSQETLYLRNKREKCFSYAILSHNEPCLRRNKQSPADVIHSRRKFYDPYRQEQGAMKWKCKSIDHFSLVIRDPFEQKWKIASWCYSFSKKIWWPISTRTRSDGISIDDESIRMVPKERKRRSAQRND